jgi:hypothetical protein
MTIRVSVAMPVRDGGPWVREAVDSVLAQDFGAFELIAVDDGSTDDTPAILAEAAARDARVRVLRPQGRGLVAALTCAVAAAQGDYLARLDADDVAAPGRLGRQLAVMEARPALGLLGSWADKIDRHGAPIGRLTPETDPHELVALLARTNPFIHSSLMLRTDLVRRLGGYRAAFEAAEDYDLWLRIAEVAEVANLPEPLIRYRWHPGNVTSRKEVRQCFSVRLAQRAAAARRAGRPDPAAALDSPPDFFDPACDRSCFAADARLYRVLALADPEAREPAGPLDLGPLLAPPTPLGHRERKLAQRALATLLRRPDLAGETGAATLLWHAVRLHPARAASLAWRYLTGAA